jgi:hypothetical protein
MVGLAMVSLNNRSSQMGNNIATRLYILEGIITILFAGCCVWLVPKDFETAYFLNEKDKQIMRERAARTQVYSDSAGSGHFGKLDIKEAAKDIKSWIHGCIQIAVVTILYGFGTFLPIIIRNGFQYSVKEVRKRLTVFHSNQELTRIRRSI